MDIINYLMAKEYRSLMEIIFLFIVCVVVDSGVFCIGVFLLLRLFYSIIWFEYVLLIIRFG